MLARTSDNSTSQQRHRGRLTGRTQPDQHDDAATPTASSSARGTAAGAASGRGPAPARRRTPASSPASSRSERTEDGPATRAAGAGSCPPPAGPAPARPARRCTRRSSALASDARAGPTRATRTAQRHDRPQQHAGGAAQPIITPVDEHQRAPADAEAERRGRDAAQRCARRTRHLRDQRGRASRNQVITGRHQRRRSAARPSHGLWRAPIHRLDDLAGRHSGGEGERLLDRPACRRSSAATKMPTGPAPAPEAMTAHAGESLPHQRQGRDRAGDAGDEAHDRRRRRRWSG